MFRRMRSVHGKMAAPTEAAMMGDNRRMFVLTIQMTDESVADRKPQGTTIGADRVLRAVCHWLCIWFIASDSADVVERFVRDCLMHFRCHK